MIPPICCGFLAELSCGLDIWVEGGAVVLDEQDKYGELDDQSERNLNKIEVAMNEKNLFRWDLILGLTEPNAGRVMNISDKKCKRTQTITKLREIPLFFPLNVCAVRF
jgi:hypothetical protein